MANKPILFSTEMVKSIERKTKTRRVMKEPFQSWAASSNNDDYIMSLAANAKYQIGDILWVRETWQQECELIQIAGGDWTNAYLNATGNYIYKADGVSLEDIKDSVAFGKCRPSIFMPKEAARIFLEVTDVRVERLQDISEEDAIAEGIEVGYCKDPFTGKDLRTYKNYLTGEHIWMPAKLSFQTLWESINGIESWNNNPFVWVYEFKQVDKPENF